MVAGDALRHGIVLAKRRAMRPVLALLLILAPPAPQAQECGGADSPCRVGLGEYHASVPQRPASERPPAP